MGEHQERACREIDEQKPGQHWRERLEHKRQQSDDNPLRTRDQPAANIMYRLCG